MPPVPVSMWLFWREDRPAGRSYPHRWWKTCLLYTSVLPKNDIAECCIRELRYFGVETKKIVRGEGRMGIYYLEGGANQLPSKVVYERAYSSLP